MNKESFEEIFEVFSEISPYLKPYHISHYKNILLCQETTLEASGGKKLGLQKNKKKLLGLPIKINMKLLL